jgi:hypothetical protein
LNRVLKDRVSQGLVPSGPEVLCVELSSEDRVSEGLVTPGPEMLPMEPMKTEFRRAWCHLALRCSPLNRVLKDRVSEGLVPPGPEVPREVSFSANKLSRGSQHAWEQTSPSVSSPANKLFQRSQRAWEQTFPRVSAPLQTNFSRGVSTPGNKRSPECLQKKLSRGVSSPGSVRKLFQVSHHRVFGPRLSRPAQRPIDVHALVGRLASTARRGVATPDGALRLQRRAGRTGGAGRGHRRGALGVPVHRRCA